MTTIALIAALLGPHVDTTSDARYRALPELAEAIDAVCEGDAGCVLDAVATCWVETRCQTDPCATSGCGPFQQLARYVDHPDLVGLTHAEIRRVLVADPRVATEQWRRKRDRYAARHGSSWPRRYNGSARAEQYLITWRAVRARAARMMGAGR